MLLQAWESVDKIVRKDIIRPGQLSKKPTECSICEAVVRNICATNVSVLDLKEKYNSEILNGIPEKSIVIGNADCEIDRQIERALQMMLVLETSLITLNISLKGTDERVVITFEITLTKIERQNSIWKWTPDEKYLIALKYKEAGVRLFKGDRCVDAFYKFSKACKILITLEPIPDLELNEKLETNIYNLRLVLYNNMAGCQLNCKNYEYTISLCDKVLSKENNNVKALYRRGVAHGNLKDLEKAVVDLKNAINLEPHNQAIKEQFIIYNTKLQEANKKFANMVRKMFQT